VAIGSSGNRLRGRAYVAMAVGPDGTVTAAQSLRGMTVFARPRPVPELAGRKVADLAAALSVGGANADLPELRTRVREAATAAALHLHPPAGGTTPTPPAPPWYRRLLHPRGGAAQA
jgi:hypothetical protein